MFVWFWLNVLNDDFPLKTLTLMNHVNDVELNDGVYVFVYVHEL